MHPSLRQRGISLIEVLVAVLIFSIGLIGMAGLMVMAARSNHAAYLRTQVTFLADSMADRMRANPIGVWSGWYNGANFPTDAKASCDVLVIVAAGGQAGCSPEQLAAHDKYAWSQMLKNLLPGASARIACTGAGAVGYNPTAQINARPPYGGTCEMTLSWTERGAGSGMYGKAVTQTFAWVFQP